MTLRPTADNMTLEQAFEDLLVRLRYLSDRDIPPEPDRDEDVLPFLKRVVAWLGHFQQSHWPERPFEGWGLEQMAESHSRVLGRLDRIERQLGPYPRETGGEEYIIAEDYKTIYWGEAQATQSSLDSGIPVTTVDVYHDVELTGSAIASAATCYLPRYNSPDEDPNVKYQNILPIVRYESSWVCICNTCDGKIDKSIKLWLDMDNIPQGWSAVTDAKEYYLRGWDDATAPGTQEAVSDTLDVGGNLGAPDDTKNFLGETTPPSGSAVASDTHGHSVAGLTVDGDLYPKNYRVGVIKRTT